MHLVAHEPLMGVVFVLVATVVWPANLSRPVLIAVKQSEIYSPKLCAMALAKPAYQFIALNIVV
jgi:hypothetical protein